MRCNDHFSIFFVESDVVVFQSFIFFFVYHIKVSCAQSQSEYILIIFSCITHFQNMPKIAIGGISVLEKGQLGDSLSILEEENPVQVTPRLPSTWESHLRHHTLSSVLIDQFELHNRHQEERMQVALHNGTRSLQAGYTCRDAANEAVKRAWVTQGIWDFKWSKEKPYTESFMSEWMHETCARTNKSGRQQDQSAYKAAMALTPSDFRAFKDWRVDDKLARSKQTSRPLYQFVYQVKTELDWYEECSRAGVELPTTEADLAIKAHEAVRTRWKKWHLWNSRWGDLPGLTWRHEMTFEEAKRQKLEDHNIQDMDATSIASDSTFHSDLGLPTPFETEFVLENEASPYKPPHFLQPYDGSRAPAACVDEDEDSLAAAKDKLAPGNPPSWYQKLASRWSKARQKDIIIGEFDKFFYFRHRPRYHELFLIGVWKYEWRMAKRVDVYGF